MITFKQFLMEDEQDLITFLKKNCQEAVNDYAKADGAFWRGMNMKDDQKFSFGDKTLYGAVVTPRKDRDPLNTPGWAHKVVNEFFTEKFGAPLRSTAVFCSAAQSSTSQYGESCVIFPIGKYEVIWSAKVPDLTLELFPDWEDDDPGYAGGDDLESSGRPTGEQQIEWIKSFMKQAQYDRDDPVDAIQQKPAYEKMMVCDKYFAVSMKEGMLKAVIEAAS